MKKEDKTLMIDKIKETLDQYSVVYLANTTSLNAEKTVDLRRAAFKAGIKMMVVKNTLLRKAMDACDIDYSGLYDSLAGPTTLLLSDTGNAPAKLIKEFRGKKETIPAFKAAYVTHRRCCGIAAVAGQERYQRSPVGWQQTPRSPGNLIQKRKLNKNKQQPILNPYYYGRFESICRTVSEPYRKGS